jgi:phage terminase Nu1 subunit (DNA packaging protein)
MAQAAQAAEAKRLVGKKQLCEELGGWSRMKLDRRLEADPDFPVETRGTQAGGWTFDVDAVKAYLGALPPEAEDDVATPAPPAKVLHQVEETARSRLNAAQAQLAEDKLRERRGELVEAQPLRMALAEAVTKLGAGLNGLPDTLVRRLNLPETMAAVIRQEIDGLRRQLHVSLRDVLTDG